MTEPSRYTDSGIDDESPPGLPRWLKLLGIALLIVALLVVALMLVGGHTPPSGGH
jgi:hypothetical protein